ncbi:MAG: hypothetical protein ACI9SP_000810 [Arenicella sp.]|jgi:hypothetical protein
MDLYCPLNKCSLSLGRAVKPRSEHCTKAGQLDSRKFVTSADMIEI